MNLSQLLDYKLILQKYRFNHYERNSVKLVWKRHHHIVVGINSLNLLFKNQLASFS